MLHKEIRLPFKKTFDKIPPLVFKILFITIMTFVFLGCANIFGLQGTFIAIGAVLMAVYVFLKSKFTLSIPFIVSIVFCFTYSLATFLFARSYFVSSFFYTALIPLYIEFFECVENKKHFLISMCGVFIGGLFTAFLFLLLGSYWRQGISFSGDVVNSFWNKTPVSRTGISLYAMGTIAILTAILLFGGKLRKWYSIPAMIIIIFVACFFPIRLGNRSFLVALAIFLYFILLFKIWVSKKYVGWLILIISINVCVFAFFIVYFLVNNGTIQLPEFLLRINVINRLFSEDFSRGRPEIWNAFFSNFIKYPFGGLSNALLSDAGNSFAHNVFLDFYTFGGFIPFAIFGTFYVFTIIYFIHLLRLNSHSISEKSLIFAVVVSCAAFGFAEPIYIANANCLTPLLFVFLYLSYIKRTEPDAPQFAWKDKNKKEMKTKAEKEFKIKRKCNFTIFKNIYYFGYAIVLNLCGKNNKIALSAKVKCNMKNIGGTNKIGAHSYLNGSIGKYSIIGPDCRLIANIGRYSSIAPNVKTINGNHPINYFAISPYVYQNHKRSKPENFIEELPPVEIGNDVWIGENVLIKGGVKIGDGAVIGMGSVVTKDVEPYSIVVGCPAKEIRKRFDRSKINNLSFSKWWEKDLNELINDTDVVETIIET